MTTVLVIAIYIVAMLVIYLSVEFHSIRQGKESYKFPQWLWNNSTWIRNIKW